MMSDKFFHQQYTTAPLDGGGGGMGGYSGVAGPAAHQYLAYQTNQAKDKPETKGNGSKSYDHRRGPAKKQGGH